jgi:ABC-type ATPase with predicted acetyltransferase domain
MKIRTANNDRYASADIGYQPSLCFQAVADRLDFNCQKEDTSIYDDMLRDTALFVDVLEILKMVGISSAECFKRAFKGLVDGMVYELVSEYDVPDENYPTDK